MGCGFNAIIPDLIMDLESTVALDSRLRENDCALSFIRTHTVGSEAACPTPLLQVTEAANQLVFEMYHARVSHLITRWNFSQMNR